MHKRLMGSTRMVFAGVALTLATMGMAATGNTPVQAAGGGASADEYAKKSDLGFQWGGDVRTRLDWLDSNSGAVPDQVRLQTRLRIGAKGSFADNKAYWGLGLATNAGDPVSRDLILSGGDNNGMAGSVGLDKAYLGFKPHANVSVTVGKAALPFKGTEAILDEDLTPPGVAVSWDIFKGSDADTVRNVNNKLAYYFVRDIVGATSDPYAVFDQLSFDVKKVELAGSLYFYGNLNGGGGGGAAAGVGAAAQQGPGALGAPFFTQAAGQLLPNGRFIDNEMVVLAGRARYPFSIKGFPIAVGGDLFVNLSESKQCFGWEAKVELPDVGKGSLYLLGRDVGQYSTYAGWADNELGMGTGYHAGLEIGYDYPLTRNVGLGVKFLRFDTFQPVTLGAATTTINRLNVAVSAGF